MTKKSTYADPTRFRPPTPAIAALALDKGVPLRHLVLSPDEEAIAIVLSKRFDAAALEGPRQAALHRLAKRVRWAKSNEAMTRLSNRAAFAKDGKFESLSEAELQLRLDVYDVVQRLRLPLTEFASFSKKGKPRIIGRPCKVEEWIPAEWDWALTLNWFFEYAVRKYVKRPQDDDLFQPSGLVLDEPVESEDGEEHSRLETLDGLVQAGGWYRQVNSGGKRKRNGFVKESPHMRKAEKLRFEMVEGGVRRKLRSNPDLRTFDLQVLQRDLDVALSGPPGGVTGEVGPMPRDFDAGHPDNVKFVQEWKERRRVLQQETLERIERKVDEIRAHFPTPVEEADRALREAENELVEEPSD